MREWYLFQGEALETAIEVLLAENTRGQILPSGFLESLTSDRESLRLFCRRVSEDALIFAFDARFGDRFQAQWQYTDHLAEVQIAFSESGLAPSDKYWSILDIFVYLEECLLRHDPY